MKNCGRSCADTIPEAHCVISRDKRPMVVMPRDGCTFVAELYNEIPGVTVSWYDCHGTMYGTVGLPFEAFDEILDLVIHFGK
jgi:hypothetical protein